MMQPQAASDAAAVPPENGPASPTSAPMDASSTGSAPLPSSTTSSGIAETSPAAPARGGSNVGTTPATTTGQSQPPPQNPPQPRPRESTTSKADSSTSSAMPPSIVLTPTASVDSGTLAIPVQQPPQHTQAHPSVPPLPLVRPGGQQLQSRDESGVVSASAPTSPNVGQTQGYHEHAHLSELGGLANTGQGAQQLLSPAPPSVSATTSQGGEVPPGHVRSRSAGMPPAMPILPAGELLGVQQLERQQAEVEKRRLEEQQHAAMLAVTQSHPISASMPPQSLAQAMQSPCSGDGQSPTPPAGTGHQLQPYDNYDDDQDTAPSSTMTNAGGSACAGGDNGSYTPVHMARSASAPPTNMPRNRSFGRILRTPLKHTQKLRHSFSMDRSIHSDDGMRKSRRNSVDEPTTSVTVTDNGTDTLSPVRDNEEEDKIWRGQEIKPLVYGYLHKLGRNGVWQRRFFETDGASLTYFKSQKRTKVLATLDLCKVGVIAIDGNDPTGCTFTIQVAKRPYYLRAENKATCKDWVINLNRVREARIQVGGFKLVTPEFHHSGHTSDSDRNRSESGEYAARVVMMANRERTRAVVGAESESDLHNLVTMMGGDSKDADEVINGAQVLPSRASGQVVPQDLAQSSDANNPAADGGLSAATASPNRQNNQQLYYHHPALRSPRIIAQLPPEMMARWHKRRSSLHKLSLRLARWARRMKMLRCQGRDEAVVLEPMYPHGELNAHDPYGFHASGAHSDDGTAAVPSDTHAVRPSRSFDNHSMWIGKEVSRGRVMSDVDEHGDSGISSEGHNSGRTATSAEQSSGQVSPSVVASGGNEFDDGDARHIS